MPAKKVKKQSRSASRSRFDRRSALIVALIFGVIGIFALASTRAQKATTGNGAPSGAHYNLNVIGVPNGKTADITSGNRIFVPLEGTCKINLSEGDFAVIDGNCSDNSPAAFQLPNPDPDGDGVTTYSVWARPVGKPGGTAKVTTCGVDPTTGEDICSIESTAFVRDKGKSSFTNVSKGFLTVLYDDDGDASTAPIRISIFDSRLQDYFWSYDNNGLRVLQLRFYEMSTNIAG